LSNAESFHGFQRLKEKRRSLEERTKTLEEKAFQEKLAIDKKLLIQILEEENRTHNDVVRELEDKIANWEKQLQPSPTIESTSSQTPPEPAEETSDVDEGVGVDVLPPPEESAVQEFQEGPKKKKRSFF
jgi:hypothetical protein